jgi:hypothetical protein
MSKMRVVSLVQFVNGLLRFLFKDDLAVHFNKRTIKNRKNEIVKIGWEKAKFTAAIKGNVCSPSH